MKRFSVALICASLISLPLLAAKAGPMEQIRVVAVNPVPEPETVTTVIQIPGIGDVRDGNPVWVQVRIDGFALGANSPFDRADELVNSDMGQTIHVIVDNHSYFAVNGPSIQPFNEEGWYYNQSYKFEIPFKLKEGFHSLRIFPARSFGESLKGEGTYQAIYFYLGKHSDGSQADALSRPYITYNEPSEQTQYVDSKPVLLDFYVNNCELSPDGYKARITIDGKTQRTLVSWRPYYIYGLSKGKHTLRLELIDEKNKVVPGPYNDIQHTFAIN